MEPLENRFDRLKNASRTGYLIAGFITNTLSIEEREELDEWVIASEENMQLFEDLTDDRNVEDTIRWIALRDTEAKLRETKSKLKFRQKKKTLTMWHYAAAASVILLVGFFVFRLLGPRDILPNEETEMLADISPGAPAAELRLSGGRVIKLSEVSDTTIADITIRSGEIIYGDVTDTAMHEIAIPRKGFFKLVLPDGTRVWLNSESSIRYPGAFHTNTREVVVHGETYFEVAKDPAKPFIVKSANRSIRAIGTAFNINSFDETVTLTEGIIEVEEALSKIRMKAGQQLLRNGTVRAVDVNPVIAWTTNQFKFRNAKLEEIMPALERWYDCEVRYEDKVGFHFNATIDRSVPVSRVLELLEGTEHVHFKIEKNVITVKK